MSKDTESKLVEGGDSAESQSPRRPGFGPPASAPAGGLSAEQREEVTAIVAAAVKQALEGVLARQAGGADRGLAAAIAKATGFEPPPEAEPPLTDSDRQRALRIAEARFSDHESGKWTVKSADDGRTEEIHGITSRGQLSKFSTRRLLRDFGRLAVAN